MAALSRGLPSSRAGAGTGSCLLVFAAEWEDASGRCPRCGSPDRGLPARSGLLGRPDGEPIVHHGYTLTSKILFKDVIETINKYAFVKNE